MLEEWTLAWWSIADDLANFRYWLRKGRYSTAPVRPKEPISGHCAYQMGIEPVLAKRMLER